MLQQRAAAGESAGGLASRVRCSRWCRPGARVLDIGESTVTLEMTGQTEEVDAFVEQLERYGVLEMARTGINALQRGDGTIHDENLIPAPAMQAFGRDERMRYSDETSC